MENDLQFAAKELVLKHKGKLLAENVDLRNIIEVKNGIKTVEVELARKEAKFEKVSAPKTQQDAQMDTESAQIQPPIEQDKDEIMY